MAYKIDSGDIKGFFLGIATSIISIMIWDYIKKNRGTLDYGEQKVIDEITSAIEGLKKEMK